MGPTTNTNQTQTKQTNEHGFIYFCYLAFVEKDIILVITEISSKFLSTSSIIISSKVNYTISDCYHNTKCRVKVY